MLCTPLLLDTHAMRPPVGAATRSVGKGVAISVSMDSDPAGCSPTVALAEVGAERSTSGNQDDERQHDTSGDLHRLAPAPRY